MKILVAVKRVVDYNVKVRAKADGSGVETPTLKCHESFDEIAVEEACACRKRQGQGDRGGLTGRRCLSGHPAHALAMGADRAFW